MAATSVNPSVLSDFMAGALPQRAPIRLSITSKPHKVKDHPLVHKPDQNDPDADLLAQYAAGDPVAASALLDSMSGRVFSLGMRMLGDSDEAQDIVQETMLRVWKVAPDWRHGEAKVASWAYGVARNLCLDRLRKRRNTSLDEAPEQIDEAPMVLDTMIANDRAQALQQALSSLPERQRQAIVLRHLEQASNPEIAQAIGSSVEAVESLLARGKRKLAQVLAPLKERI